jgi:predicted RNA-binding protein (virulence factor B family)
MIMQIRAGYIQTLPYYDATERGFLLGDDSAQVFISKGDTPKDFTEGQDLEVFVYYNEAKELEATTMLPEIQVGQVGCFRVRGANDIGAFINIGTRRDILVPKREQLEPLEVDRMALVILCEDTENERLFATTKLNRMMQKTPPPYQRGDEVQLIIAEKIDIGRRVIVDGKYIGALFRQEMTDRVRLGEKVKGYVRKVEGKDIVVSMQREGLELLEDAKAKILSYLEINGGYARLNDDTEPEEIKLRLHVSKKTFKKAAGMLFKEGKVLLTKFGIKINKSGEVPQDWEGKRTWVDEDDEPEKTPFKKRSYGSDDDEITHRPRRSDSGQGARKPFSDREKNSSSRENQEEDDDVRGDYNEPRNEPRRPKQYIDKRTFGRKPDSDNNSHKKTDYKKPYSDKPREDRRTDYKGPKSEKPYRERKDDGNDGKPKKTLTFKGKK